MNNWDVRGVTWPAAEGGEKWEGERVTSGQSLSSPHMDSS